MTTDDPGVRLDALLGSLRMLVAEWRDGAAEARSVVHVTIEACAGDLADLLDAYERP